MGGVRVLLAAAIAAALFLPFAAAGDPPSDGVSAPSSPVRLEPHVSAMNAPQFEDGTSVGGTRAAMRPGLRPVIRPAPLRPPPRPASLPRARWEGLPRGELWSRTALSALKAHGRPLLDFVPSDIAAWCPSYAAQPAENRAKFWVSFLSALARYESTFKPRAVGGGGLWYGLMQILPSTAAHYGCHATTGEALLYGPANLSCAIRIMARTVRRDGVVGAGGSGGVAADWGPLKSAEKREAIAAYTASQSYCRPLSAVRPHPRPARKG